MCFKMVLSNIKIAEPSVVLFQVCYERRKKYFWGDYNFKVLSDMAIIIFSQFLENKSLFYVSFQVSNSVATSLLLYNESENKTKKLFKISQ